MKIYLVGGAVRDELLGRSVKERDWVVVGSNPEEMIKKGFKPVGKDFPVFLHPTTHEEYALARTERKIAKGYKGFEFYANDDVTLEEDLARRDLTVNAIAKDEQGNLIDPYHGQVDLKAKILRHVSQAFVEDPVRILRTARFGAKLDDFSVNPETNQLMQQMVAAGEVDALVAERVWKELQRALGEANPIRFFEILKSANALQKLFPPIDFNKNGLKALKISARQNQNPLIRFAVLFFDLTPTETKSLIKKFRIPNEFADLALLVSQYYQDYKSTLNADSNALLKFLKQTDALRREQRFNQLLQALEFCAQAENDPHYCEYTQALNRALNAVQSVDHSQLQQQNLKGQAFADALYQLQIKAIEKIR